jgi:predicted Zn-dependent protease
VRVSLRPLGDVPAGVLKDLAADLAVLGPDDTLEPAPLRPEWFDEARKQYRTGAILEALAPDAGDRALGVTAADLFSATAPYRFVFGEALVYAYAAVVSVARLGPVDPERYRQRIAKEAIHELGHTLGIVEHCENRGCVMAFSNSPAEVDRKTRSFCRRCQSTVDFTAKRLRT